MQPRNQAAYRVVLDPYPIPALHPSQHLNGRGRLCRRSKEEPEHASGSPADTSFLLVLSSFLFCDSQNPWVDDRLTMT